MNLGPPCDDYSIPDNNRATQLVVLPSITEGLTFALRLPPSERVEIIRGIDIEHRRLFPWDSFDRIFLE